MQRGEEGGTSYSEGRRRERETQCHSVFSAEESSLAASEETQTRCARNRLLQVNNVNEKQPCSFPFYPNVD
ncbi:uncharacterized protein ACO6RY_06855 [Pungitius sinensis]